MEKQGKWQAQTSTQEHMQLFSQNPSSPPIRIGTSVWFAQKIFDSSGMVEYHPKSRTTSPTIPYPAKFDHSTLGTTRTISCKYKKNSIAVLCPSSGCGIMFDTESRTYGDVFSFTGRFDYDASCVTIGDSIHIFHGSRTGDYTIYSMKAKTAKTLSNHLYCCESGQDLGDVPVIKSNGFYQSANKMLISGFIRQQNDEYVPSVIGDLICKFCRFELLKFAGWDLDEKCSLDSFYVGTLTNENVAEPVEWKLVPQWRMKHLMYGFGCIQYGSFVLTFGGLIQELEFGEYVSDWTNSIYILDLRNDRGWVESPIKCPEKAQYNNTVLDDMHRVHLFPVGNTGKHYWIDVKDLIPETRQD